MRSAATINHRQPTTNHRQLAMQQPQEHVTVITGLALACLFPCFAMATPSALAADGRLVITVVDRDAGKPIATRMHLRRADGKARKPKGVPFWHDHFVFPGEIVLDLPKGNYFFELEHGPEYLTRTGRFTIEAFADDAKQIDMKRFVDMSAQGWWSGDLDVRREIDEIELAMGADDLHVATVETWSNRPGARSNAKPPKKTPGEKVVGFGLSPVAGDRANGAGDQVVCFDGNRYYSLAAGWYTWPGTTLFCLNATKPPGLAAPDREFPPPLGVVKALGEQPGAWVDLSRPYCWDLPMLVAAGQVDSIEIAHANLCREQVIDNEGDGRPRDRKLFPGVAGNARWSQEIYFKLLDCGLRIPPSAGSGSGEAPNPVGYNRMYVHVEGPFDYEKWWQGLRAGRVTVTNGPLLLPRVHGQLPGHVFQAAEGETAELQIDLTLSTRQPISYLEIVKNGQVEHTVRLDEYQKTGKLPNVRFDRSGWFLVRAVTDLPKTYRFAMTGPYYVEIGYRPWISRSAAQFFLDWVHERARQIQKIDDPAERGAVLAAHRAARDFWQDLLNKANAE